MVGLGLPTKPREVVPEKPPAETEMDPETSGNDEFYTSRLIKAQIQEMTRMREQETRADEEARKKAFQEAVVPEEGARPTSADTGLRNMSSSELRSLVPKQQGGLVKLGKAY
jgi:hypothetical protein